MKQITELPQYQITTISKENNNGSKLLRKQQQMRTNSIKLPNYHNTKNKLKEKNVADYQITKLL